MSHTELEQLLTDAHELTENQPENFREALKYIRENEVDPSIREFVEIIADFSEPGHYTTCAFS